MRRLAIAVALSAILCASARGTPAPASEKPRPLIQVALLLDTSGSMRGLIDQAKSQLWKIVNEFATAKRAGDTANLEVALYEYGKASLPASEGYIRLILPLTTDLDKVSEELFALTVNGGQEYCGQVIKGATEALIWSESRDNLKAIFIAGNEPFTQGSVDYREACKEAIARGITVSTIFCGPYEEGVRTDWQNGAMLADGDYMNIDQNAAVVHIPAPQDKEIARLGEELNATYVPYGTAGKAGQSRQAVQDSNARNFASAGSEVQRAVAKASVQYRNATWDLVDAVQAGTVKIEELKSEDLPEEMRSMSREERMAFVQKKLGERSAIQEEIKKLNEQREQFVAQELEKLGESSENTLDAALIKALARQAQGKDFELESR